MCIIIIPNIAFLPIICFITKFDIGSNLSRYPVDSTDNSKRIKLLNLALVKKVIYVFTHTHFLSLPSTKCDF